MAAPHVSPESSLGQLGKALLRFFKPVIRVAAHKTKVNSFDGYQQGQRQKKRQQDDAAQLAHQRSEEQEQQSHQSLKPIPSSGEGSGIIDVKRDPSVPWVKVVTGLMDSCQKGSTSARSHLGSHAYGAKKSGGGHQGPAVVGKMIDLRTIISDDQDEDDETADPVDPSKKAAG